MQPINNEEEILAKAKWLFAQECEFVAGASTIEVVPEFSLPEIAFVGRSNVGKSSLINSLTNRTTLARVSHTPGRTKQLNFFALGQKLMLVDLPGYGYAKAPKGEIAGWNKLITKYLKARPTLRRVCLLLDSRHPYKESDEDIMKLLDDLAVIYQIVLTKTDKCTKEEIEERIKSLEPLMKKHVALHPQIIMTSARKNNGIDDLRIELTNFI